MVAETKKMCDSRMLLATMAIALLLPGCGESGPFEYVPVTGKVSFEDGALIEAASIKLTFTCLERGEDINLRPRPASASANVADGTFDNVTSYKYGDGLVPGKHRVAIIAMGEKGDIIDTVPKVYTSAAKSPLIIDTADEPLEIKIPKS